MTNWDRRPQSRELAEGAKPASRGSVRQLAERVAALEKAVSALQSRVEDTTGGEN